MKLEVPRSTKVWTYIVGFMRYQQSKKYSIQQGKKFSYYKILNGLPNFYDSNNMMWQYKMFGKWKALCSISL